VPSPDSCQIPEGGGLSVGDRGSYLGQLADRARSGHDAGGVANDAERARPSRLIWQTDDTGATCDLSGLLRDSAHMRQARSRCLRCCPVMTVTTLGRPPHRAREGHGQHLQIRSLVSGPDNRHADHLGLGAALRSSSRLVTIGRVNALMVFKSVRGSRPGGATTCVAGTRRWSAKQDHPAYIPRILRPVRALTSVSTSREASDQ